MHIQQPRAAMDISEATKIVMSRIRNLDIENASRIMGYILIQDRGEQDMIMLALGPDALLISYVNQAKAHFALNSSNPPPDSNIFPQSTPRILIPNNGFHYSNPSSPANFPAVLNDFDSQFFGADDLLCGGFEDPASVPPPHRRSHSVNDAMIMSHLEEGGSFEKRPCSYYARGYCKNGNACKFLHVDNVSEETIEAIHNQRFSHMASRNHRPSSSSTSSAYSKSINFLNENSRRGPRNERSPTGLEAALTSRSRQIYLTFPHESTFREEDVCSYFSKFGPVQDVRIPHQDKRMFGFVTFAFPETVKRILAKGNPHFVCDSRVLVKPYKDKGKFADKKHQIWDSPEAFEPPIGSRMLSTQDMILMRNLEKAELQHTIELETRRMMDLRLMDHRFQPSLPLGAPVFSPRGSSELLKGENGFASYDDFRDVFQEFDSSQETGDDENSLEHILPENLFTCEDHSVFYNAETEDNNRPFGRVSPR